MCLVDAQGRLMKRWTKNPQKNPEREICNVTHFAVDDKGEDGGAVVIVFWGCCRCFGVTLWWNYFEIIQTVSPTIYSIIHPMKHSTIHSIKHPIIPPNIHPITNPSIHQEIHSSATTSEATFTYSTRPWTSSRKWSRRQTDLEILPGSSWKDRGVVCSCPTRPTKALPSSSCFSWRTIFWVWTVVVVVAVASCF